MRPSTPIALLALFVALGGGAYAATSLPANSVGTKQIKRKAVTLSRIAPSARKALKGATGLQGAIGPLGPQGPKGDQGVPGQNGTDGAPGQPYSADSKGNVYVANPGASSDTNTIRIGTTQQQRAFMPALLNGPVASSSQVVIDTSTGQIGVQAVVSSRRFKELIHPLGGVTGRLMRLRPVTFRYRSEPGSLRYGLIAEEVAKVFPALVTHDTQNRPNGIRYQDMPALLLSQVQAQQREIRRLQRQVARLSRH